MSKSMFTEMEIAMFTPELNVKRYLKSNIVDIFKENQMATLNYPNGYGHGTRVHNDSVALTTGQQPVVKVKETIGGGATYVKNKKAYTKRVFAITRF